MKLVVNCLGGALITGFAESLALGKAGGLELADMVRAISVSGFRAPLFEMKGEQVLRADYATRFPLALGEKDGRLVQEEAQRLGIALPVSAASRGLLGDAVRAGHGEEDIGAVCAYLLALVKRNRR
jgi:3-hydroxyisobutyrate dehydrogenase-like beta-hydroxyacid dehydrogenase